MVVNKVLKIIQNLHAFENFFAFRYVSSSSLEEGIPAILSVSRRAASNQRMLGHLIEAREFGGPEHANMPTYLDQV